MNQGGQEKGEKEDGIMRWKKQQKRGGGKEPKSHDWLPREGERWEKRGCSPRAHAPFLWEAPGAALGSHQTPGRRRGWRAESVMRDAPVTHTGLCVITAR